jgi:hypothetical protein
MSMTRTVLGRKRLQAVDTAEAIAINGLPSDAELNETVKKTLTDTHKRGCDSTATSLGAAQSAEDMGEVWKPMLAVRGDSTPPATKHRPASLRRGASRAVETVTRVNGPRHDAEPAVASTAAGFISKESPMPQCGYCHRVDGTHSKSCKSGQPCKLCAKRAPEKCLHHGGASVDKTAGRRERIVVARGKVPRVAPVDGVRALLIDTLEEELVQTRAEVRVLESMLGKARA